MSAAEHDDMHWEELAAGFALHALEPEDELAFRAHLSDCTTCQATLDDHSLVAAQMASLVDDTTTAAPPWSRIRPGLGAQPARVTPPQRLRPLPAHQTATGRLPHPRHARLLAAAAAFVGVAGVAIAGWQIADRSGGSDGVPSAVSACRASSTCHVVRLLADSKVEAGDVLVRAGSAAVVPTAMPALDASHVYVLWQIPRDGQPTPVTALPHVADRKSVV